METGLAGLIQLFFFLSKLVLLLNLNLFFEQKNYFTLNETLF